MDDHPAPLSPTRAARQTALVYALVACGWILVTDWLLLNLPQLHPHTLVLWQAGKGLGFVAATSLLLFLLLRAHLKRRAESERRFSTLGENLPGLVFRCENDRDWTMRDLSRGALYLTGYAPEELIDNARIAYGDLILADDRERVWEQVQAALRAGRSFQIEYRLRRRDGRLVWISEQGFAMRDPRGGDRMVLEGLALDISERKAAEEKLREAAAVFASTAEGVAMTGLDGRIREVNQAFCEITGYRREDVIGRDPRILQSARQDRVPYVAILRALRKTGRWRGEIRQRCKDGSEFPSLLTLSPVLDDQGRASGYVGVFSDITALKRSEERLQHLAHHDPLTDLPNRLLLHDRLERSIQHALRRGDRLAVLFLDIDRFKHINDSLGHPVGDELLRQLARRLSATLRGADTLARISGDELIVLLDEITGPDQVVPVARKLLAAAEAPFRIDDEEVRVTASIGISLCPDDGRSVADLLRHADAAMYRAKEDGGNGYSFYKAEMTAAAFEHVFLDNALRSALDRGELHLVYQPQVDLVTGQLIGLEALVRWRHPHEGLIPPSRFIPVAEQTGQIREIGRWVLKTACDQGRRWLDQGLVFGLLAVNVSGRQIRDERFVVDVEEALAATGLAPQCLELEVSEDFVMDRIDIGVRRLRQLRDAGICIAIDDFGTGYSSLSHLKQLPIDKLKIDRAFVRDIPADRDDMAICEAVVAISHALNLVVVAEGVETDAQAAFLRSKGCRFAQGYRFGRPMPAAEIEARYAGTRADA